MPTHDQVSKGGQLCSDCAKTEDPKAHQRQPSAVDTPRMDPATHHRPSSQSRHWWPNKGPGIYLLQLEKGTPLPGWLFLLRVWGLRPGEEFENRIIAIGPRCLAMMFKFRNSLRITPQKLKFGRWGLMRKVYWVIGKCKRLHFLCTQDESQSGVFCGPTPFAICSPAVAKANFYRLENGWVQGSSVPQTQCFGVSQIGEPLSTSIPNLFYNSFMLAFICIICTPFEGHCLVKNWLSLV